MLSLLIIVYVLPMSIDYSHGMDADTLIRAYNRIINYLKAFPSFLSQCAFNASICCKGYIFYSISFQ